jgi:hypothetical protein
MNAFRGVKQGQSAFVAPELRDSLELGTKKASQMPGWKLWLALSLVCAWPLAASADENEAAKLIAECGAADLPQASVDSCVERVRVLEETEPSAELHSLEGSLERRESGADLSARAEAAPASPADTSGAAAQPAEERYESAAENPDRDSFQPLSGSEADDQPPIADPPDHPSDARSGDDQTDSPE